MAVNGDCPLRLARVAAGLSQVRLAGLAGSVRSAVSAVEDGRVRVPDLRLCEVLRPGDGVSLQRECVVWFDLVPVVVLSGEQRLVLGVPPYVLGQYFGSWVEWRRRFASSVTGFASLLRVNVSVVREFELGRVERLGPVLGGRLVSVFGLSSEYLLALEGLRRG